MLNKKVLSKINLGSYKKPNPYSKDIIYDPKGQWKYPGQNTRIPGEDITMQGVPYPVYAQPNVGQPQMMYPDQNYQFPGADYVDEFPQMKKGGRTKGLISMPKPSKKGLMSKKYSRSLDTTNKLFTENYLFAKPKSRKNKVFDPNSKYYAEGGEYIDAELTPEEIEEYRANGYIVDDTIYAKGGESSCLKGEYWNGTKCVKIPKDTIVHTDKALFDKAYKAEIDNLNKYNYENKKFQQSIKGWSPVTDGKSDEVKKWILQNKKMAKDLEGMYYNPTGSQSGELAITLQDIPPKKPVIKNIYEEPIVEEKKIEEKIENLPLLKPSLIQQKNYELQGNPLNEEELELPNEEVESKYLEEGSPDTENPMEWVNKRKYNIDWDGLQIPFRLPRFRKPGSYGPLIKKGKQRYINLPTIESRNTAYLKEEKNGGALLTKEVTCKKCGWEWDAADGGKDITTCHKCNGQGLIHAQKGGEYFELDLTPEEIQQYAEGGFIVEDISIPSLNQMQDGGGSQSNGEIYKYLGRPDSLYRKSLNGRWLISNDSTGNEFVSIEDPKGSRTKELDKNAVTVSSLNKKRKDHLIKLHKEIAFPKEFVDLKDTRTVRATTGEKINPNVDLKGDKYNKVVIDNIIKKAKAVGVDPSTMLAIALQETDFGKKDANLGHALYGDTAYPYGYIDFYKDKLNEAKRAKIDNELLQIQYYNGLGTVYPETEEDYHGFKMQKIYGVPLPASGINMRKNPLYGKQIIDLRDNVVLKNPYIQKALKEKKQGGASNDYVDVDLTLEEIKDLIAQGYVIEELN